MWVCVWVGNESSPSSSCAGQRESSQAYSRRPPPPHHCQERTQTPAMVTWKRRGGALVGLKVADCMLLLPASCSCSRDDEKRCSSSIRENTRTLLVVFSHFQVPFSLSCYFLNVVESAFGFAWRCVTFSFEWLVRQPFRFCVGSLGLPPKGGFFEGGVGTTES